MKSAISNQIRKETYLKVVKNNVNNTTTLKSNINRIYINTLMPGFNYIDNVGNLITPRNCALI
ncbi:hypothetical protein [Lutibacter sp.]|uniref:hypothetical protein n=1 Tax=Lutibacter sp. TaxID=1925666 RepID=UPI003566AA28